VNDQTVNDSLNDNDNNNNNDNDNVNVNVNDRIASILANMTTHPGVYRMLNAQKDVIYVGKAKNLKNRVRSYFSSNHQHAKTRALVAQIQDIEITITQSETEALLLEQSLIKKLRPNYNVILRDDRSYPFIHVSNHKEFPRISFHRGLNNRNKSGKFFGPYPSSGAVRETLSLMQKVFKVRQCDDIFFKNRSRPCLQYQIGRCSAPCVNKVSYESYQEDLQHTLLFLEGKSNDVNATLSIKMEQAAEQQKFEQAAKYRDQIIAVRKVQEQQYVVGGQGDIDVISAHVQPGGACIHVLTIEDGRVLGSKNFFPKVKSDWTESNLLASFLPQFYLSANVQRKLPKTILLSHVLESWDGEENIAESLIQAIEQQFAHKLKVQVNARGDKAAWVKLAQKNAQQSLKAHLTNKLNMVQRLEKLKQAFQLEELPERLECYDISHTMGEATVASCVVFNQEGPLKTDYRKFNIEGVTQGDDYAAMKQVLERRFTRLKKGEGKIPDVVFIDGGKGQLQQAASVLEELQIEGVELIGIAKGTTRKAGLESLWRYNPVSKHKKEFVIPPDSPALHLIQHIRDESHRFAISGHRAARAKKRNDSPLQSIPGVGPKRRKALLNFFGGWREVSAASAQELAKVPGVSKLIANEIYQHLHDK
jgi:excinuclease ABC subunit C